jgi:hypothetical protein
VQRLRAGVISLADQATVGGALREALSVDATCVLTGTPPNVEAARDGVAAREAALALSEPAKRGTDVGLAGGTIRADPKGGA